MSQRLTANGYPLQIKNRLPERTDGLHTLLESPRARHDKNANVRPVRKGAAFASWGKRGSCSCDSV